MRYMLVTAMAIMVILAISACSQEAAYSAPKSTPAQKTATLLTAAQTAEAGKTLFSARCSRCHGDNGQGNAGPALIGATNHLEKYTTALGLFDFTKVAMPMNAPGSLRKQDYLNVLGFLLVQNDFVSGGDNFDPDQLQNIRLKK